MNEFVSAVGEWFIAGWPVPPQDGDGPPELCEYVIGPKPVSDDLYDEGAGD
jgi:hypothetical protein